MIRTIEFFSCSTNFSQEFLSFNRCDFHRTGEAYSIQIFLLSVFRRRLPTPAQHLTKVDELSCIIKTNHPEQRFVSRDPHQPHVDQSKPQPPPPPIVFFVSNFSTVLLCDSYTSTESLQGEFARDHSHEILFNLHRKLFNLVFFLLQGPCNLIKYEFLNATFSRGI